MIINVYVDPEFKHPYIDVTKFTVDFDPNETIENLKTIISLKFTDLDPSLFELTNRGKLLNNHVKLIKSDSDLNEPFVMVETQSKCCTLF